MLKVLGLNITCCFWLSVMPLFAEVIVYPGANEQMVSDKYRVRVIQEDKVYDAFVYKNKNTNIEASAQITDNNHWVSFSFDDKVKVEVTKLTGDPIMFCIIRPKKLRFKPEVNDRIANIYFTKPQSIYVEMNQGEEDPLFIFANPIENNVPDTSSNSLLYFGPGLHNVGQQELYNKDVYIHGSAYVKGNFILAGDRKINVYGRGVISGIDHKNPLINSIADQLEVNGIVFSDANNFCVTSDQKVDINYTKFFGWSLTSKGVKPGALSIINDCFFKVDDDIITINHSDITISNCVMWQQSNGAPFQFTQSENTTVERVTIRNTDIIRIDLFGDEIWKSDKTIFNCLNLSNSTVRDILFDGLRVEANVHRLLGINTGTGGLMENITFKEIEIEGVLSSENFISAENGAVKNILFDNVKANYMKITNEYDAYIERKGNVEEVKFKWRSY